MSEQLKFYKGNESNLPSVFEMGAIYHCLDTGNTYLATSASTLQIFSTNKKIYIQNDEPTDAPEGSLWIDLDAASEWEIVTSVAGKTGAVTLQPSDVGAAPVSHASSSATYGSANNTNYGHVRLSASTSSTSGVTSGYAATPSAVKSAYDLANGKPDLGSTAPSALGIASAGSATTAAKSDHIHPMQTKTVYATSSTSASTGTKIATTVESIAFSLVQGARVSVKFSNANTTTSLTYLNVNSTGAKLVRWRGATLTSNQYWASGQVVDFIYDGSYWNMIGAAQDNSGTSGVSSLTDLGVTATATELNYVDGVTSAIQTQLDGKADSSHTQAASTITSGTFPTTYIYAKTGTDYTTGRIRNIKASTTDLTAGTSTLNSGDIYLVYE